MLYLDQAHYPAATTTSTELLTLARQTPLPHFVAKALFMLAKAEAGLGNLPQAIAYAQESLVLFQKMKESNATDVEEWIKQQQAESSG